VIDVQMAGEKEVVLGETSKNNAQTKHMLISFKTCEDRTIHFGFPQLAFGARQRLKLRLISFTTYDQDKCIAIPTRALQKADGIVINHTRRLEINLAPLLEKQGCFHSQCCYPNTLPLGMQFDKRDPPEAVPLPALHTLSRLNGTPAYSPILVGNSSGLVGIQKVILMASSRMCSKSW
jgi:hypothetical protein